MKKLANQIMSFILVLTMVFATGTTAFAAEQNSTLYKKRNQKENGTVKPQMKPLNSYRLPLKLWGWKLVHIQGLSRLS